jgi:hypothetical protein
MANTTSPTPPAKPKRKITLDQVRKLIAVISPFVHLRKKLSDRKVEAIKGLLYAIIAFAVAFGQIPGVTATAAQAGVGAAIALLASFTVTPPTQTP